MVAALAKDFSPISTQYPETDECSVCTAFSATREKHCEHFNKCTVQCGSIKCADLSFKNVAASTSNNCLVGSEALGRLQFSFHETQSCCLTAKHQKSSVSVSLFSSGKLVVAIVSSSMWSTPITDPTPRQQICAADTAALLEQDFEAGELATFTKILDKNCARRSVRQPGHGKISYHDQGDYSDGFLLATSNDKTSRNGAEKVPRLQGLDSIKKHSGFVESGRRTLRGVQEYLGGERSTSRSLSLAQVCYNCALSVVRMVLYSAFVVGVVLMVDALEKERRLFLYSAFL
eukprot:Gregarina_sp_Poly_1__2542@NODE_168_length_12074_cov_98_169901_g149_i0_p5_GENE_NODE_168_length_12074_cov_98_169901_g149_i0NODE_168_length_12074_cov_98_169901_g149_i0_p5_ORF_typecomplete_len289_score34_68TBP/PF00352_21/0_05_NODE_168_length_12074_cov_98_169901_g149_i073628228